MKQDDTRYLEASNGGVENMGDEMTESTALQDLDNLELGGDVLPNWSADVLAGWRFFHSYVNVYQRVLGRVPPKKCRPNYRPNIFPTFFLPISPLLFLSPFPNGVACQVFTFRRMRRAAFSRRSAAWRSEATRCLGWASFGILGHQPGMVTWYPLVMSK